MKILFIAQPFPYPPNTGSRNLIYHWLEAVSRAHDVHLMWLGDPAKGKGCIQELPGVRISAIRAIPAMEFTARIRRLTTAVVMGIPPTSLVGMIPSARAEILRIVREGNYDVVVLTENVVAGYAPILSAFAPVVLFKHSVQAVDTMDARRRYGIWNPRWILEEWMVKRFEATTCRAATVVCTVNIEDASELARRYRLTKPAQIVPIGVELSKFPKREGDPGGQVIGFFGNVSWGANLDAVRWFVDQVLPRVWEKIPLAQFRIIGPGSENAMTGKRDPRIIFQGPSNVPDAMRDAVIGVVPVISGTGVRLKLLEMLSMGVPVVTTPLGALGTGCAHGEHALIADDAASFSAAVITLIGEAEIRQKLTRAGRELVQKHSWQSFYPRIVSVLEEAASADRTGIMTAGTTATQEAS